MSPSFFYRLEKKRPPVESTEVTMVALFLNYRQMQQPSPLYGVFVQGLFPDLYFAQKGLCIVVAALACGAYIGIGRKYVHRWSLVKSEKTNVDALVGKHGVVLKDIGRNTIGMVKSQ